MLLSMRRIQVLADVDNSLAAFHQMLGKWNLISTKELGSFSSAFVAGSNMSLLWTRYPFYKHTLSEKLFFTSKVWLPVHTCVPVRLLHIQQL